MSDLINKIKATADIVELISDHVPLKRSGANYVGLCPFHKDSKPSMSVSPSKQIFKCFSCDTGGDVLKFWSEYHKKTFAESIKDLALRYGIPLEFDPDSKAKDEQSSLHIKMHELAAEYYLSKLQGSLEAQHCRDYLNNRKITTETIIKFKLGYSPADKQDWSKLLRHLKESLNCSDEEVLKAGLASKSDKDPNKIVYYDRFRGRLMIPIRDERGRVIAFGARALTNPETGTEPSPKYLNSSDTDIYTKGEHLFGLDQAREAIRKEDAAIVVEGYFDAISLYQAGITNVVANQGTALTQRQAKLLCKYSDSKRVYLCFDTDKAGEEATERAIETIVQISSGSSIELRIIRVTNGKDPDELVSNEGAEAFRELVKKAPLIFDYQLAKILESLDPKNASPQEKSKAITKLAKYLGYIKNKVEQSEYIKQIAAKLELSDEAALRAQLNIEFGSNPYKNLQRPEASPPQKTKHLTSLPLKLKAAEFELLVLCLCYKDLLEDFLSSGQSLVSQESQEILDALTDISFENPNLQNTDEKFLELQKKLSHKIELNKALSDIGMATDMESSKANHKERFISATHRLKAEKLLLELSEINAEILSLGHEDEEKWKELNLVKARIRANIEANRNSLASTVQAIN